MSNPSQPNQAAHQSVIGWLIKQLRQLPSTRQAFFKLATVCYSLTFLFLVASLFGERVSKVEVAGAILLPLLFLVLVGFGAWVRQRIDQRFSPSFKRKVMLHRLVSTVTKPHPSNADEYIFKKFRPSTVTPYHFPPPDNDRLIAEAAKLNCAVFLGSAYEDTIDSKQRRNHSHQLKNPYSLMLVSHQDKSSTALKFIGFTHLIPVNEATYHQYLDGKIQDNAFSADLVCSLDEPAYAVIIFSLGIERYRMKRLFKSRSIGKVDRVLSKIGLPPYRANDLYDAEYDLWVGLIYHLRQLLQHQTTVQWPTNILAQSFNKKVMHVLTDAGFKQRTETSADGEPLFELKLSLHEAVAQI